MFCTQCGKEMPLGVGACPYCGSFIKQEQERRKMEQERRFVESFATVKSFHAKNTAGLTNILKICTFIKVILYTVSGSFFGVVAVVKELIFANIAENVNVIAKNTAENNKR